jgi:hypothetical protein
VQIRAKTAQNAGLTHTASNDFLGFALSFSVSPDYIYAQFFFGGTTTHIEYINQAF